MEQIHFNPMISGMGVAALLVALWGLCITVFWMIVGWRAMRAHEQLAQNVQDISTNQRRS